MSAEIECRMQKIIMMDSSHLDRARMMLTSWTREWELSHEWSGRRQTPDKMALPAKLFY
jgi:hypothetical protein